MTESTSSNPDGENPSDGAQVPTRAELIAHLKGEIRAAENAVGNTPPPAGLVARIDRLYNMLGDLEEDQAQAEGWYRP